MTIKLVVQNKKEDAGSAARTMTLEDLLITIGSGAGTTVRLVDAQVAPEQGVIVNENGQPLFINRSAGTILNGAEVEQGVQQELKNGDCLTIGSYDLFVELEEVYTANGNGQSAGVYDDFVNVAVRDDAPAEQSRTLSAQSNNQELNSFADILSSLRQDEDQYYFQVNEADDVRRRLPLETDEMLLGWNDEEQIFTSNHELAVDHPQAIVRKDWSGVTIYPSGEEAILINNALLEAGVRLKNGDKLTFSRRMIDTGSAQSLEIVFCEPAALIELNAILPQELLSNALEITQTGEIKIEPGTEVVDAPVLASDENPAAVPAAGLPERAAKTRSPYYFGYFTSLELIILTVGTILTILLTYLLLELS